MKKYSIYAIALVSVIISSCTKVIDVDLPVADPRLVVEASIDWEKGTTGSVQTIKLSTTTPYFDKDQNNMVTNATVIVTNNATNQNFTFVDQENGEYLCSDFIPVVNHSYTLNINYKDERYIAVETLMSVTEITRVEQSTEDGFDKEAIELNMYVPDPADEENYYMVRFYEHGDLLAKIFDVKDEFVNGNEMKFFIEKLEDTETNEEEFIAGDIVDLNVYGISEAYYNYIKIVIEQSEAGGVFSTIPVALKGNCLNTTNPNNYPYGYFRLTQVVKTTYTVQ